MYRVDLNKILFPISGRLVDSLESVRRSQRDAVFEKLYSTERFGNGDTLGTPELLPTQSRVLHTQNSV